MTTTLRQAYELIRDENRWCQGWAAVDANGDPITVGEPNRQAVRWCAAGAAAQVGITQKEGDALVDAAVNLFPTSAVGAGRYGPILKVNDELGHAAIMQVFEKAIVEMEGSL